MRKQYRLASRILACMLIGMLACPPAAFAGGLTPDTSMGKGPGIGSAGNGVPIVNITTPSQSGVSHNQYKDFNVNKQGLILNNSKVVGVSQLGGVVEGNSNLKGGEARLILNEVTGSDRSRIQGYMEVFGKSADVILANPNGVTINGGGFINVPRASVVTGRPDMDAAGNLRGIDVRGGDVLVEGAGINASNIDGFDIVTRAAVINAQIHAKDLSIVTGTNRYDPATRTASAIAGNGEPAPSVAIDSRALGGMYAGRITLKSTEKGVGVNLDGVVQSVGDMVITTDGRLAVRAAKAGGSLRAASRDAISVGEAVIADKDLTLTAKDIAVNGGSLGAYGNLKASAEKSLILKENSQVAALGDATLQGATLTARQSLVQGATVSLGADELTLSGTQVKALSGAGKASITAKRAAITDRSAVLANNIAISSGLSLNVAGSRIEAVADATLGADALTANGSNLYAGRYCGIAGSSLDLSETKLAVEGAVSLALQSLSLAKSDLWSAGAAGLTLDTSLLVDADSSLIAHGGITLAAKDADNHGLIYSGAGWESRAESFVNHTGGALLAQGDMVFTGRDGDRMRKLRNESATIESLGGSVVMGTDLLENVSSTGIKVKNVEDSRQYWVLSLNVPQGWDANGNEIVAVYGDHIGDGDKNSVTQHALWMHDRYGFSTEVDGVKNHRTLQDWLYKTHQELDGDWVPGDLMAANDIRIDAGRVVNNLSNLSAGRNLAITADSLENKGVELTETLRLHRHMVMINNHGGGFGDPWDRTYYSTKVYQSLPSVISAGETASLTIAGTLDNKAAKVGGEFVGKTTNTPGIGDVAVTPVIPGEGTSGGTLPLPSSLGAMFTMADPGHPYVIETDPRIAGLGVYFGSDYFFGTLGVDRGSLEMKVLGDAYFESTLIRRQILQQTGQRYLQPGMGDAETVRALMDNAAAAGRSLGLTVGVALTADQVKNLTADIVWMEEQEYMGQKVLVPRVYLCEATLAGLGETRGAVVSGRETLVAANAVINSGAIKADTLLSLASNTDIRNRGGDLFANTVVADAGGSIINASGSIRGGDILLAAGKDIISETLAEQRVTAGQNRGVMHQVADIAATGNLRMEAGRDVALTGSALAAGAASIGAGRDITVSSLAMAEGHDTKRTHFSRTGQFASSIDAGSLGMSAGRDMTIAGSTVAAQGDASLVAGRNLTVTATENTYEYRHKRPGTKHQYEHSRLTESAISTGGNLTMAAGADASQGPGHLVMVASRADAKGDASLSATGNVILASATERDYRYESKKKKGFLSSSSFKGEMESYTNKGSSVSGGNVTVRAGDNVLITASGVHAEKDLGIKAERGDIIASAAQDTYWSKTESKKSSLGLGLSFDSGGLNLTFGKSTAKNGKVSGIESVGSFLSAGNNIDMAAGRDIGIIGSAVAADNDITMRAGRDVNLVPGREGFYSSETKKTSTVGVSIGKPRLEGVSVFAGARTTKEGVSYEGSYTSGSLVDAGRDVTIVAGRDVNQVSSHIVAGRDVNVGAGRDWVVAAAHDVENLTQYVREIEAGVTVSARQNITDAARTVINMPKNIGAARGGAGYTAANAVSTGLQAIDSVRGALTEAASVSAKIGASYSEYKYTAGSETAAPASISAGRDIVGTAGRDITLEGARVNADRDVVLDAGRDVNIVAATSTSDSKFSSGGGGGGVGVKGAVGSGGVAVGINVSANAYGADGVTGGKQHTNAVVTAGDTLSITSGRDTNIKGAHLEGDKVWIDTGRNLTVESLQDSFDSRNSSWNAGIDVTVGYGVHVGGNAGVGHGSSSSKWVGQQTSIVGKSDVDIYTGENTHIKGGLIYADNGKLKLDTDTLTYEAVKDKNKGYNLEMGFSGGIGTGQQGDANYSPPVVSGSYEAHDMRQINRPTVGEGEIIVRSDPDATLEGLNRDITKAREITKNDKKYANIYISKGAIDTLTDAGQKLGEMLSELGLSTEEKFDKRVAAKKEELRERFLAEGHDPAELQDERTNNLLTFAANLQAAYELGLIGEANGIDTSKLQKSMVSGIWDDISPSYEDLREEYDVPNDIAFRMAMGAAVIENASDSLKYMLGMANFLLGPLGDRQLADYYETETKAKTVAFFEGLKILATNDVIQLTKTQVKEVADQYNYLISQGLETDANTYLGTIAGETVAVFGLGFSTAKGIKLVADICKLGSGYSAVLADFKTAITFEPKILKQMAKRGWDVDQVRSTIQSPAKTVRTVDIRWENTTTRMNQPATAYIASDGSYVVKNDISGKIVQVSNKYKPEWRAPWEESKN